MLCFLFCVTHFDDSSKKMIDKSEIMHYAQSLNVQRK